ncbi:MAG: hypothetical protein BRD37_01535 [Bacteroidetes bacterium QH_8_67_23]|nr:MAG: hypothetical protein BRD37_01535 [Bacteroidetes bacterium QH_8_67_23]
MSSDAKAPRFGIAEWFGHRVQDLTAEERERFAQEAKKSSPSLPCPPRASAQEAGEEPQTCTKEGGVCSLRLYDPAGDREGQAGPGPLVAHCPHRFKEGGKLRQWIGQRILKDEEPAFVKEVPFLERDRHPQPDVLWERGTDESNADAEGESDDDVGRIDGILVSTSLSENAEVPDDPYAFRLAVEMEDWCALEIQSVYFSGDKMSVEYDPFAEVTPPGAPFPSGKRRPDFRSSSAKRLLPQLQTKIPSLRRWGKKMAVAVDEAFFYEMAPMEEVPHLSNCDIVWVVLGYEEEGGQISLRKRSMYFTTLEDAVEGLTAGKPVSQEQFEARVAKKVMAPHREAHVEQLSEHLDELMQERRRLLQPRIDAYKTQMKRLRANRARLNKMRKASDSESETHRLARFIDALDNRIETVGEQRASVEEREEMLKEECKAIRSARAEQNQKL